VEAVEVKPVAVALVVGALAVAVLLLVKPAFPGRYTLTGSQSGTYKLDTWTGQVWMVSFPADPEATGPTKLLPLEESR
jgi:hypothetical protein